MGSVEQDSVFGDSAMGCLKHLSGLQPLMRCGWFTQGFALCFYLSAFQAALSRAGAMERGEAPKGKSTG